LITLNNIEVIHGTSVGDNYPNQDPQFIVGNDNINADSNGGVIWLDGETGEDKLVVGSNTPSRTTVAGGYQADEITVRASSYALVFGDLMQSPFAPGRQIPSENILDGNDVINVTLVGEDSTAFVYGQGGDDTINVTSELFPNGNNASVFGGSGEDTITVTNMESARIDGGADNDTINVTPATGGEALVLGGTGDDTITITSDANADVTIVGGAGDDTIVLTDSIGTDTLQFGNINYSTTQTVLSDTQGTDAITDYNWEAFVNGDAGPVNQDIMDFSAFLSGSSTGSANNYPANNAVYMDAADVNNAHFIDWGVIDADGYWDHDTTVVANSVDGNSLVVLSSNGLTLSAADFSVNGVGTIQLNDNARAVVVLGTDGTGADSGIDNFNIYFVQDVDTTNSGQTWHVDLAATVDSLTLVGVQTVFDNLANNYIV
jgi:Ca2+-binding RTX toxin-like protein